MDKLRLIRENEEQFKKHLEEIENLKIQEKEQKIDNMILQSNDEQKKQEKAEKYLTELRKKVWAENSGLIKKQSNDNKLHENLNNYIFNQIYDDSDDDFVNQDSFLQYNHNENEFEYINNFDDKYPNEQINEYEDKSITDISNDNVNNKISNDINNNINKNKNSKTNYSMNNNINNDITNEFSNNFNSYPINILSNNITKNYKNNKFDNIDKKSQTDSQNKENRIFTSFEINKKIGPENSKNINNIMKNNNNIDIFNSNNYEQKLTNKINNFIKELNEKLNINYSEHNIIKDNNNNLNEEKTNNNKNQNIKKHSNLGKTIGKYLKSYKGEENKKNYNEMVSKIFNQTYTPYFKKNSKINNNNTNINRMIYNKYENYKPFEKLRKKTARWKPKKDSSSYNIRKAIQENKGKKEYRAHTYSTVKKIKNINQSKKTKSKIIYLYIKLIIL